MKNIKKIILVMLLLSLAGCGTKPQKNENNTERATEQVTEQATEKTTEEATTENKIYKKGETAKNDDLTVTLNNYKTSKGSEYNKPKDGKVFLLAEFEIENTSDKDISISSMLNFNAFCDDYALDYSLTSLLEKDGNQLDGTISPNKKLKGWIGWEVPKDYSNVEINFKPNIISGEVFTFSINK